MQCSKHVRSLNDGQATFESTAGSISCLGSPDLSILKGFRSGGWFSAAMPSGNFTGMPMPTSLAIAPGARHWSPRSATMAAARFS